MPFDGLTLNGVIKECKMNILGSRIQRVYQPSHEEVVLCFSDYNKSTLLLSSLASGARIHLTQIKYDNPEYPPAFCMVLRKYLIGGILKDIYQVSFDRIAVLEFESLDDAGNLLRIKLIIEIMGKHSNIILVDAMTGKILDAIKHVSGLKSSVRKVMPNFDYIYPPNEKLNPIDFDLHTARDMLTFVLDKKPYEVLCTIFCGVSKQLAQSYVNDFGWNDFSIKNNEIIERFLSGFKAYLESNIDLTSGISYFKPNGESKDYSIVYYSALGEFSFSENSSISCVIDNFHKTKSLTESVKQRYAQTIKNLELLCEREHKKLNVRQDELDKAKDYEMYNMYGNLILSNLYSIKKGDDSVTLNNFYSEGNEEITISLKRENTPSQNAQMFFKKYNKAKSAIIHLEELIEKNKNAVIYLDEQLYFLNEAESVEDAERIIDELIKAGYVKKKNNKTPFIKTNSFNCFRYFTQDGYEILAGKNSFQNNRLTFKIANKDDIWLHAKDVPASHVILRTNKGEYSNEALSVAAQIAVFHSKLKDSAKVPVDYTYVKNVKKIVSSGYGNVTFIDNKTVYMTVDQRLIKSLKQQE